MDLLPISEYPKSAIDDLIIYGNCTVLVKSDGSIEHCQFLHPSTKGE